ncbi:MAG: hypothetical protein DRJ03_01815 [Chloroflexi bacterium]|nr:MAG: hypothetical protein DRJ03_01815 [Chloroflexota bacterium]
MAKRGKTKNVKEAAPKKTATPANPKPKEPSVVAVNEAYDRMPDTIEDPAAVFRMAMLDMKRVAVNNKLAFVAMEQEKKVQSVVLERDRALKQVKAELADAERELLAQKEAIEAQYGIVLRSYTYNDETGVLTKQAILKEEAKEIVKGKGRGNKETAEPGSKTLH